MQGSDAPRPRATVAHLRFRKQAAPCSSQTLHRNTALYLQENAQPRSKRTSPPLRGCRGATLPALEQRSRTSDSANKQRPARPKRSIGTLCATLNRNAQPRSKRTSPPLRGCRGATLPAFARWPHTSDSANKRHPARPKRSIGTLRSTFKKTPNRTAKEPRHPLRGCRGATLPALARRSRTSNCK